MKVPKDAPWANVNDLECAQKLLSDPYAVMSARDRFMATQATLSLGLKLSTNSKELSLLPSLDSFKA
jgi:hypothetical protein